MQALSELIALWNTNTPWGIYVFVFFISIYLGSFYNVVALRTLSGESIIGTNENSHCTTCGHELNYLDMVPIFSWLFLKGKCRYCGDKLSPVYPFGELLTGISYTVIVWQFGFTLEALVQVVLMTVMIWATITDLKEMIVPDRFTVIGLILVGILRLAIGESVSMYFISGLLSFLFLLLILVLSGGRMGGADVKLYALIGLAIGIDGAIGSLFYASFIGVLINLPIMIKKKDSLKIPFVPFITAGILLIYIHNIYGFLGELF